jgi:glycosyltransferase involved in cell wall biosynthesis
MQQIDPEKLPSFSIVLETENLETADISGLIHAIANLAAQDPPPSAANEVFLIDSGDTPLDLLDHLRQQSPWITVITAPPSTGYYSAKMLGATKATGEVIVYYDSDCLYSPNWLRSLLTVFAQRPDVQIVAGETTTRGVGIYGTAMALTYIFPQFSNQTALQPTPQYFLNNVAFRRELLLQHPIPIDLPLYRGNCVIHAHQLQQAGHTIWKLPQARTLHAPPNGMSHWFWRFLLIGHDLYWQKQLLGKTGMKTSAEPISGIRGKLQVLDDRIGAMIRHDPRHLIFLPLALPVVLASVLLILVGYWLTVARPHLLLKVYSSLTPTA